MSKRYPAGILRKTPQTPSQTSAQGVWNMTDVTQAQKSNTWPIAGVPDPMSRSLRFRSSASAYLNRTPSSAGNRKTWTWSGWVKRGILSSGNKMLFGTGNNYENTYFNSSDVLVVNGPYMSGQQGYFITTQVFRDPSAWYHVVCAVDTTQATASNRVKIYVNGSQITALSTTSYPSQNYQCAINNTVSHKIGSRGDVTAGNMFDGYMAEIYLVDGQQLDPSSFGATNASTGVSGTNANLPPYYALAYIMKT